MAYIDRERLIKHYENCIDEVRNTNGNPEDFETCLKALKNQPIADVIEVKHGKCLLENELGDGMANYKCSVSMKEAEITYEEDGNIKTITIPNIDSIIFSADFVDVVRCKHCIHKVQLNNGIFCGRNAQRMNDNWYGLTATKENNYCNYGERKDDE